MMEVLRDKNYINQVQIDCVIFGYEETQLKVLVSKINYKGDFYSLPSGYIYQAEDTDHAAKRILKERTGISDIYLEQFKIFGKADKGRKEFLDDLIKLNYPNQANRAIENPNYQWFINRFISIGYYALVDIKKTTPTPAEVDESIGWHNVHDVPKLIMDYNEIFEEGLKALKRDIDDKLNVFNLLPESFTMKEVQEIYETIFEKEYIRTNFQKKILDMNVLERLEKKYTGAKNKAPYLYRFRR